MSYYILAFRKKILAPGEAPPPEELVKKKKIDFLGVIPYEEIRCRFYPVSKDDRLGEPWRIRLRRFVAKRRFSMYPYRTRKAA